MDDKDFDDEYPDEEPLEIIFDDDVTVVLEPGDIVLEIPIVNVSGTVER